MECLSVSKLPEGLEWLWEILCGPPHKKLLCRRRHNQYLYCHPGPDGKLIQAKYFGKVRDDIEIAECAVSQLKVKANDSDQIES